MNGIEKIMDRIAAETREETDRLAAAAEAEAARIEQSYRAQADREAADARARGEKDAAELEARLVGAAGMERRRALLAVRQTQVDAAFEQAMETLCALPEEKYAAMAARLLTRAAPDGRGEAVFSPADRERIGRRAVDAANRALNGTLTLSDRTREMKGGFILVNGNVEVNCSFETLLRLQRAELAGEVAALLFPKTQ